MAYTTEAIVREESPFNDAVRIDADYVDRAIDEGSSLIDSYIGVRYVLPLSVTPTLIQNINTNLAIYYLVMDQNLNIEIATGINMSDLYDQQIDLLTNICEGKPILLDASGVELPIKDRFKPAGYPTQSSTDDGDTAPLSTIDEVF